MIKSGSLHSPGCLLNRTPILGLALLVLCGLPSAGSAQPMGSFAWQLQPYCNRVTVAVTQNGAIYTLDGVDDQCGAAQRAPLVGVASLNADGSITFGLHVVTVPGGAAVHIEAHVSPPALSGTWSDSAGSSGVFAFAANTGGSPRPNVNAGDISGVAAGSGLTGGGTAGEVSLAVDPAVVQTRITQACGTAQAVRSIGQDGSVQCEPMPTPTGDIGSVTAGAGLTGGGAVGDVTLAVDPAVVQTRITQACGAGQAVRSIGQDGSVACEPMPLAAGDIASVTAGAGLTGGGAAGDVTLAIDFGGSGAAISAARSDHTHGFLLQNTAVGEQALASSTGGGNTALGHFALRINTTGLGNTALGSHALAANTEGHSNTAIGAIAMFANSTGRDNTAVGSNALADNTTGWENTAVGAAALLESTTGYRNTAIGVSGLQNNTTGYLNVATGASALHGNTEGSGNTAAGSAALLHNTTGGSNTALGGWAMEFNETGHFNTAVGIGALSKMTTGDANIAVGNASGFGLVSGSSNIYLGASAGAADENGTMRLGANVARTFVAGARGRTTDMNDAIPVVIDSLGQLGTVSSSRRTKNRIEALGDVSRAIFDLRPVRFTYREPFADGTTPIQFGLIAEEVAEVLPELVALGADGEIETVKYHVLPTLLLAEVQRLERERVRLNELVAAQAAALKQLTEIVESLRQPPR